MAPRARRSGNGARRADRLSSRPAASSDLPGPQRHHAGGHQGRPGTAARAGAPLRQPLHTGTPSVPPARRAGPRPRPGGAARRCLRERDRVHRRRLGGRCARHPRRGPGGARPTAQRGAARGHPDHRASRRPGCLRLAGARSQRHGDLRAVDREGLVDPAAVEGPCAGDGARVADGRQQRDRHTAAGPGGRRHHPRLRGQLSRPRPGRRQVPVDVGRGARTC